MSETPPAGSGGSTATGSGGSTAGSGGSAAGTGGDSAGSGGSTVPDAAGSGGAPASDGAVTETAGSGGMVVVGTKGVQADPGSEGDGTIPHPAPYPPSPETVARMPGVPVGKVLPYKLYTSPTIYKENGVPLKFNYTLYIPAQYQKGKPAAFMVFLDGQHFAGPGTPVASEDYHWNAPILFDNLIASGDLPVTILAFMDPGTQNGIYRRGDQYPEAATRSMEYDRPVDTFSRFLLEEFIPNCVTKEYDIVDDPDGWGIGGHSSGGIAAIIAGWFRPDKFRKLHSSSGSYPNTNGVFPNIFNTVTPAKPIRITMLSGTNDLGGWYAANNNAATILKAKGYHYRYRPGTDNHTPPLAAINEFATAMRWLWRGYSLPWYKP
jgi:enterochelin esterase family protein